MIKAKRKAHDNLIKRQGTARKRAFNPDDPLFAIMGPLAEDENEQDTEEAPASGAEPTDELTPKAGGNGATEEAQPGQKRKASSKKEKKSSVTRSFISLWSRLLLK